MLKRSNVNSEAFFSYVCIFSVCFAWSADLTWRLDGVKTKAAADLHLDSDLIRQKNCQQIFYNFYDL